MMLFVFDAWSNPALFQTGWFVESLLTQTLIIHIIRTAQDPVHREPRQRRALIATTIIICCVGIALPFTWAGAALGFTPLPWLYWPLVAAMLVAYAIADAAVEDLVRSPLGHVKRRSDRLIQSYRVKALRATLFISAASLASSSASSRSSVARLVGSVSVQSSLR